MARISEADMAKRMDKARAFFRKNPSATVADLNKAFSAAGEQKMGQKAYDAQREVLRELKARGGTIPARRPAQRAAPVSIAPAMQDEEKIRQTVLNIVNDLARQVAGSRVTSVYVNLAGEVPVIRLGTLKPYEEEIRLGESVASLRAPEAPRAAAPAPAPAPAVVIVNPAGQPVVGNVTTLPANGGGQGAQPQP